MTMEYRPFYVNVTIHTPTNALSSQGTSMLRLDLVSCIYTNMRNLESPCPLHRHMLVEWMRKE